MNKVFKYITLLVMLCVAVYPSVAQDFVVSGQITDSQTGEPLSGANIYSTDKSFNAVSDVNGNYTIYLPQNKNIELRVSYVGYKTISRTINSRIASKTQNFALVQDVATIGDVTVTGHTNIATSRGDTTVYRISKVNSDATLGDAISKIPGFRYENGQLEINGEQVTHLMLDGVDFFRGDVGMALKNLNADIIDRVEVFDKKSDYAELTGFDDGNSHKAVNIRTKKETRTSTFGKAYAGYGSDSRYKSYGMFNTFDNDFRWSVFAQANNTNEQNFSMIDLLSATGTASSSAPSQSPYSKNSVDNTFHPTASDDVSSMLVNVSESGITDSRAVGTNYSDSWGKNNNQKVQGHYLFNSSSNDTDYDIEDEYYGKNTSDNVQKQIVNTDNINHRFNAKYEYNIGNKDYLMVRPSIIYQRKNEDLDLTAWTRDSTVQDLLLNQNSKTSQNVFSNSDEVMYLHRLSDKGHSVSFDGRFSYIKTTEDIDMVFENVQANQNAVQQTYSYNIQKTFTGMMSYIHPFGRYSGIKADAGWNVTYGVIKRKSEIMADEAEDFSVDSLLCGSTFSDFGGLLANLAYMFSKSGVNIVAGTEYQAYNFRTKNDITHSFHRYNSILPYFVMRCQFGGNQLHLQYRTLQKYPGLMQVQDAINNANATMAVRGNNRLESARHQNIMMRLVMPGIGSDGSVGVVFVNMEYADNFIASRRSLSAATFTGDGNKRNSEMYSYQNADGYFSTSGLVAYGFPANFIKSNINLSSMLQYAKTPGFWDEEKSFTRTQCWNNSATIASNISEAVDFILDFNCKYTQSRNLTYSDYDVSYWTVSYGGQINWQIIPAIKLLFECGRTSYSGSGTSQFNAVISNAAVAYKFAKERRAELRLSVNDIFNNDNNFVETTNEIYRRKVTSNVLKRYIMLTFTYNFNKTQSK